MDAGIIEKTIVGITSIVAAVVSSGFTFLLTRKRQRAEIEKLEAETQKIRRESDYLKWQMERIGGSQVFELGLRSPLLDERAVAVAVNDLATLLATYLITQRLLEGELRSWGDVQSFVSRRRKDIQQFINTVVYGYFRHPKDGVLELRDVLVAAVLNRGFLNEDLHSVIERANSVGDVINIENVFKRAFEKAVRHPLSTILDCLDERIAAKYGYAREHRIWRVFE